MVSGCGAVGSALPWGGRGRKFKSCHSDQEKPRESLVLSVFSAFDGRAELAVILPRQVCHQRWHTWGCRVSKGKRHGAAFSCRDPPKAWRSRWEPATTAQRLCDGGGQRKFKSIGSTSKTCVCCRIPSIVSPSANVALRPGKTERIVGSLGFFCF